jgi:hypothetical protein
MEHNKNKGIRTLPATKKDVKNRREFLANMNRLSNFFFGLTLAKIMESLEHPSKTSPETLIFSLRDKIEPAFQKKQQKILKKFVNQSINFYSRQIDDILIKNNLDHTHSKDRLDILKEEQCDYALKNLNNIIPYVFFSKALHILQNIPFRDSDVNLKEAQKKLKDLPRIIRNRNRLIAYNETGRILAITNELRYLEAGLYTYIWRTSEDERVVGNPTGLYPIGNWLHENHYVRDGKVFRWDMPPSDGHPGIPINCRCVALPIVK